MKLRFSSHVIVVFAYTLLAATAQCFADSWPLVRGDQYGSGVAHTKLPDAPELLWQYQAGDDAGFDATAVVDNGVIYLGDNAGTFHAVRLDDGKSVWKKPIPDTGFSAGAAVEKGRLYVGDMNGVLYCLATTDGKELWKEKLDGEVYAGPTINGDDVLFTSEAGVLSARTKQNGAERWAFRIDAPLRCTPTIAGGRAALAGCDSRLHVIDVSTGKETGSVEIDGPTGSTPAMRGEHVFFGTETGTFYAIEILAVNNEMPLIAWPHRDPQRQQPIRAAAAINDHVVVYGSQGKAIYGLDPETGKQKWKLPTKGRIESSPVIVNDRVIAATTSGKIYLLDVESGEITWEHDVGGSFVASPAVVDGKFILGNSDGTVYCFGRKTIGGTGSVTENKVNK